MQSRMLAKCGYHPARSVVCWSRMSGSQQEFLRELAATLGLGQEALAERMGASWATFGRWLLPTSDENAREMPANAWQLAREILAHEKLSAQSAPPPGPSGAVRSQPVGPDRK